MRAKLGVKGKPNYEMPQCGCVRCPNLQCSMRDFIGQVAVLTETERHHVAHDPFDMIQTSHKCIHCGATWGHILRETRTETNDGA